MIYHLWLSGLVFNTIHPDHFIPEKWLCRKYPERYSCCYRFGTRNMWMLFSGKTESIFKELKAKLVGNIALVDRHDNYTSVLTILRWLTTGKKKIGNASCSRSFG
jgi:hypothetical protein